jgi:hypothetical protein
VPLQNNFLRPPTVVAAEDPIHGEQTVKAAPPMVSRDPPSGHVKYPSQADADRVETILELRHAEGDNAAGVEKIPGDAGYADPDY